MKTKVIKIKASCGNGGGCNIKEYVLPYSIKKLTVKSLVKKAA